MTGLCCHFLLVALCCAIKPSLKRDDLRYIYQPYGPKLCKEKCPQTGYTYYFLKNDLSCHRHPPENSPSANNSCRRKDASALAGVYGVNVCDIDTEGKISNVRYEDAIWNLHFNFKEAMTRTAKGGIVPGNHNIALHQACEEGNLCLVKFIIFQNLSDINLPGRNGRTPVMAAASKGQVEVFNFLVTQRSDLTTVDVDKNTVLHIACVGGNTDIVRRLIHLKHDVDSKNKYGVTPVMIASFYGHVAVVKLLVDNSCDIKQKEENGYNILHMACKGGHVDTVRCVLEKLKCDIESRTYLRRTPIMVAAMSGHTEVVKYLVQKGCNLTVVDKDGYNILHRSCTGDNLDVVRYIILELNFKLESKDYRSRTPVMIAAGSGQIEVVKFLVQEGCNMAAVDKSGSSILEMACFSGNLDLVKYVLREHQFDVDKKDNHGRTPVMIAAYYGRLNVVKYFVERKCNLTAIDAQWTSILQWANSGKHKDVIKFLKSVRKRGS